MNAPTKLLSLEEFRACHSGDEKPYFEYWNGEAIQKAVPTTLHGILQQILCMLFTLAGCRTGSEIELRIDPHWQPKPDVIASRSALQVPYPSKPVELVAEILSPEDSMHRVFEKCLNYKRIGIQTVLVFDPESRLAWEWNDRSQNLDRLTVIRLPNSATVLVETVWLKLDEQLA